MVNHGPEDLEMMTKAACVSHVRQTMEVAENAQKGPIGHLIVLMHWQRTWPGWRPLQTALQVADHDLHTFQVQDG
jgi:hypothetical protein